MAAVRLATREYVDKLMKCDVYALKRKIEDYNGRGEEIAYDSDDIECYVSYMKRKYDIDNVNAMQILYGTSSLVFFDYEEIDGKGRFAKLSVKLNNLTPKRDSFIMMAYYDDFKNRHIIELKLNITSETPTTWEEIENMDVYVRYDFNNVKVNKARLHVRPAASILLNVTAYDGSGLSFPYFCSSADLSGCFWKRWQNGAFVDFFFNS